MPDRFKLEYTGDDNKAHQPVMLHRAILGTFERFLAVFIEHCAGIFPTWLAPVQVTLITITKSQDAYAKEVEKVLRAQGIRVKTDLRNEKLGFKIREAQLQKMPYMLIIGEQEMKNRTLSVRLRNGTETKGVSLDNFVHTITTEVRSRALPPLTVTTSEKAT